MNKTEQNLFRGTQFVSGVASGTLLAANLELSFWGGVDQKTGEVIDRFHPLSGCFLKDTILAIPGGRGSCSGSIVMLELMLSGSGPKALVFERAEEILTLGVIVAEEFFKKTTPVVSLRPDDFRQLLGWNGQMVHVLGDCVSLHSIPTTVCATTVADSAHAQPIVQLSKFDREALEGVYGEATRISMKIIIRTAQMMGAKELMDISQAHIDCAWYGPGSLALGLRLRDWGGKFRVPTTLNSTTVDHRRWKALGIDNEQGQKSEELSQAFLDMGAKVSFTCAPYLLDGAPELGDNVAWGESNAVVYANSVLGARTLKNPNILECLIALTGRAPKAGVHFDENRLASVQVKVQLVCRPDDAFWPILGYTIGALVTVNIPAITGLEDRNPTRDDLKAFSAAFATSSSAPMFHMVNTTPEAPTLEATCQDILTLKTIVVAQKDLEACWEEFNNGSTPQQVDLISLGNPHFSVGEIKELVLLCQGRAKHPNVAVIITCGRAQHQLAAQAGYVEELEKFGVQFLSDTCWCFVQEPIIPKQIDVIMTNSGKYVHYGPGLTGKNFCFGSLSMCVEAACSGKSSGLPPPWLRTAET